MSGGSLARGGLHGLFAMLARAVLQGALLIFLSRGLGSAQFGLFVATASLALGFGALASSGMGYLVLIRSGVSDGRGRSALASALPATVLIGICLLPVYLVVCQMALPDDVPMLACVAIGVAELVFASSALVLSHRIQGSGEVGVAQLLYVVPVAIRLVWICGMILIAGDGVSLSGYSVFYALSSGAALLFAWRLSGRLGLNPPRYRRPSASIMKLSLPYALTRISAYGPAEIDKVLAPSILSPAVAGSYALVSRGLGFMMLPVNAMLAASQPRMALLHRFEPDRLSRLALVLIVLGMSYGLLAAVSLSLIGGGLLGLLVGNDYESAPRALSVLCWAIVPMAIRYTAGGMLLPMIRPLPRIFSELLGLLTLFILMPVLAHRSGVVGAAWAVVVSESLMAALLSFVVWHILRSKLRIDARRGS